MEAQSYCLTAAVSRNLLLTEICMPLFLRPLQNSSIYHFGHRASHLSSTGAKSGEFPRGISTSMQGFVAMAKIAISCPPPAGDSTKHCNHRFHLRHSLIGGNPFFHYHIALIISSDTRVKFKTKYLPLACKRYYKLPGRKSENNFGSTL